MLCVNVNEAVRVVKIKRVIIRTFLLISIAIPPAAGNKEELEG
jgi:hypothetical protein